MVWDCKVGKLRSRDRLLDGLALRGDETVLDVGCGRGLLLIGAAKRLTTGTAVGVDIWQTEDLSGNRPEATLESHRCGACCRPCQYVYDVCEKCLKKIAGRPRFVVRHKLEWCLCVDCAAKMRRPWWKFW